MGFNSTIMPPYPRQRESADSASLANQEPPEISWNFLHAFLLCSKSILTLKQGSRRPVSRVLSTPANGHWTAIPLGRVLPPASSNQPGRQAGNSFAPLRCRRTPAAPIRFCSRWGFPCPPRYRRGGALLPHPFTLTPASRGGLLSVALSLGSPPPAVSRHRISVEPGLSSGGIRQRPSSRLDRRVPRADYRARQPYAATPPRGRR
jgi:hypothetical protein